MKPLLQRLNLLHGIALALILSPLAVILALGMWWLWQSEVRWIWLVAMAVLVAAGYGLQAVLVRRNRQLLDDAATDPDPSWPQTADAAWAAVGELAESLQPADWPLGDGSTLLKLGRRTLEIVAHQYHPHTERPLLELTLPHTLLIIERASRDLRKDISEHVPFSHRLTIGAMNRARNWSSVAEQVTDVYRAGRLVINPIDGLLGEIRHQLLDRSTGKARTGLHQWLLRVYVRKVGFYAIDLYSGRLPLDDSDPVARPTAASQADLGKAEGAARSAADTRTEPLRILVAGKRNAGKSSLINALFGKLISPTDVLGDTTRAVSPHVLERDGLTRALVFDSPGSDSALFDPEALETAAQAADLILWVCAVNRPDRQADRVLLDRLRALQAASTRRPPSLLVVASHIDQLRPIQEWQPPYDLDGGDSPKAVNIRAACEAVADDLGVTLEQVIPVCLAPERVYNVADGLWAAMLAQHDTMLRSRLVRCLETRRREEDWGLVWQQLRSAGRLLRSLPERLKSS